MTARRKQTPEERAASNRLHAVRAHEKAKAEAERAGITLTEYRRRRRLPERRRQEPHREPRREPRHLGTNGNRGRLRARGAMGGHAGRRRERLRAAARERGQSQVMAMVPDFVHCHCYSFDLPDDAPRICGLAWRCPRNCPCAPEDERMARATGKHHPNWPRVPGRAA